MRLQLGNVLPEGTLDQLADAVMGSWKGYQKSRKDSNARTGQQRNEDFFYFQKQEFGTAQHYSDPNPEGWLASPAAQDLIELAAACTAGYLEQIVARSGSRIEPQVDPDDLHVWASVHCAGSNHGRHIHYGAAVSAVFYVTSPPGAGRICFFDPRGEVPPFERSICYAPRAGDLLLFPPWLSHSVGSTGCNEAEPDGARISISFNLVDEVLEGGPHGWGSATAGLEVMRVEGSLGIEPHEMEHGAAGASVQRDEEALSAAAGLQEDGDGAGLPKAAREGLMRVRAALAAAGREGQDATELRSVLHLVAAESAALAEQLANDPMPEL